MVNRCSKFLHFGRKSWGEFEKPTPEVPILGTVCHLDSICGVFQQTLSNGVKFPRELGDTETTASPTHSHFTYAFSYAFENLTETTRGSRSNRVSKFNTSCQSTLLYSLHSIISRAYTYINWEIQSTLRSLVLK